MNSKKIIKLTILVSFLCLLFVGNVKAFNVVKPTQDFYVNDYANLLEKETKETMMKKSIALYESSGVQIVVLTINNLDGATIDMYANQYYNENKIGGEKNDGILIILSKEERAIRVEVGDHLEGILPDGKVGGLIDKYAYGDLKENRFNTGIEKLYNELYKILVDADLEKGSNPKEEMNYKIFIGGVVGSGVLAVLSGILGPLTYILFLLLLVVEFVAFIMFGSFILAEYLGFVIMNFFVLIVVKAYLYGSHDGDSSYSHHSGGHSSGGGGYSGGGGHSSGGGASRNF